MALRVRNTIVAKCFKQGVSKITTNLETQWQSFFIFFLSIVDYLEPQNLLFFFLIFFSFLSQTWSAVLDNSFSRMRALFAFISTSNTSI